jgi:chromosomal replication initiator protein
MLNDSQTIWEVIRKGLAQQLPKRTFTDWIEPCMAVSFDGTTLLLSVPSPSARIWIEQQLAEEFHDVLVQANLANLRLDFVVAGDTKSPKPTSKQITSDNNEVLINSPFPQGFHRYTLDRFVVGPNSQLAFAAANAVVESHGKTNSSLNMNPLFIYGASGLGKTHLMIGIGKGLLIKNNNLRITYLKVDNFFNELTVAIRAKNTEPMRKKYQQNDVLLLDDVQTLGKMERTQEEIFYILEYLLQYGKQIVITSDKPPQKLEGLHDRLITRCKWGLTADIQPPDFETRVAILRKKLEDDVFNDLPDVPENVITFIAHKARGSVRDLEGLLTRVVFQSSFLGVTPNIEVAQIAFKGFTGSESNSSVSIDKICQMTAETYNVSFNDLIKKKSRQQSILLPRQVAMFLARELTASSFADIGKNFNNMHHSTVMNAINSVKVRMQKDDDFNKVVHSLLNSIQ